MEICKEKVPQWSLLFYITEFTKAITDCLDNFPEYEDELKSLLSLKFQDLSGNNFKKKSDTDNNKKTS